MKILSNALEQYKPLFTEDNHSATSLHLALLASYGPEYLDWELETIELNIKDDLEITEEEMDTGVFDRLHALIVSITTEVFYKYLESFEDVIRALNFSEPNFSIISPCLPPDLSWGIIEVALNDSQPGDFSTEVQAYIRECLHLAGFYNAPKNLQFSKYDEFYDSSWIFQMPELSKNATLVKAGQRKYVSEYIAIRKNSLKQELMKYFPNSDIPKLMQKIDELR